MPEDPLSQRGVLDRLQKEKAQRSHRAAVRVDQSAETGKQLQQRTDPTPRDGAATQDARPGTERLKERPEQNHQTTKSLSAVTGGQEVDFILDR
ncbi:hypothetical protein VZT92_013916 [Zoarces viviparus]|uniref:Uncharacterized protein n=1 Tax=Zoarces viviparus TaxID=48416 RepID=A0AAW1EXK5_ZOAVI